MGVEAMMWAGARVTRREAGSEVTRAEVVDADRRSIRVVMSTDHPVGGQTREDGDVIVQSEWDVSRWLASGGVVLRDHVMGPGMCGGSAGEVVGNGSQVERDRIEVDGRTIERTLATVTWSRVAPGAEVLAEQYATGERSDFSVGFTVGRAVKRTSLAEGDPYRVDPEWSRDSGRPGGRLLRGARLIELSAVTVGADEYARVVRSAAGLDASGLLGWGERRLALVRGLLAAPEGRSEALAVVRALAGEPDGWAVVEDLGALVGELRRERARAAAAADPLIRALASLGR